MHPINALGESSLSIGMVIDIHICLRCEWVKIRFYQKKTAFYDHLRDESVNDLLNMVPHGFSLKGIHTFPLTG